MQWPQLTTILFAGCYFPPGTTEVLCSTSVNHNFLHSSALHKGLASLFRAPARLPSFRWKCLRQQISHATPRAYLLELLLCALKCDTFPANLFKRVLFTSDLHMYKARRAFSIAVSLINTTGGSYYRRG